MQTPLLVLFLWSGILPQTKGQGIFGGAGDALKGVGDALSGSGQHSGKNNSPQNSNKSQSGLRNAANDLGTTADDALDGLTGGGCKQCPPGQKCNSCQSGGLGNVTNGLGNAVGGVTGSVDGLVNDLGDTVTGTTGGLLGGLTGVLDPAVQLVLEALGPVVQGLLGAVDGILDLVLDLVAVVVALLLEILGEAGPDVSQVLGPLVSLLNNGGAGQGELVSSVLDQIKQGLANILKQAGPDVINALGPLASLLDSLGKQAANIGRCPCTGSKNCGCPSTNNKPGGGSTGIGNGTDNPNRTPSSNTPQQMGRNLQKCLTRNCQVVCLVTGCTVDGVIVNVTFQDLLMEAKNRGLGFAGTVTGLSIYQDGVFDGDIGQSLSRIGFNPNSFIGKFGLVPDATIDPYPDYLNGLMRQVPPKSFPPTSKERPANLQKASAAAGCPAGQSRLSNNNRTPSSNQRRTGNQNRSNKCPRYYQRSGSRCVPIKKNNNGNSRQRNTG